MSMNNKFAGFLMFVAGVAVGSVVTWRFTKAKYERIANEEIKSVKEVYSKKEPVVNVTNVINETKAIDDKPSIYETKEYLDTIKENGYRQVAKGYGYDEEYDEYEDDDEDEEDEYENSEEGDADMNDAPYVISPEEFGNRDDHTCVNLSYYADGVLADDWDTVVLDPIEEVGPDIASHFGEYEEDTVFIRNEKLKVDYEICRDLRTFAEVIGDEAIDQSDD